MILKEKSIECQLSKCINEYIERLKSSNTEDEVLINLKRIIKAFSVDLYIEPIMTNPYFRELIIDVKEEVLIEMLEIRQNIKDEILNIDREILKSFDNTELNKLRELKRECLHLLKELDNKKVDLNRLI